MNTAVSPAIDSHTPCAYPNYVRRKCIVVTMDGKIGKSRLTQAQGAPADLVAMTTTRTLMMAWVLTLPCAIALAGGLYRLFSRAF